MKIAVLQTLGNCSFSSHLLKKTLTRYGKTNIIYEYKYLENYDVIAVGGGKGVEVMKYIDNIKFRNIVKDKYYIGICCGAYIIGDNLIFDNNIKKSIDIFPVSSCGPYFKNNKEFYDYSINNELILDINYKNKYFTSFLKGGGYFTKFEKDCKILGKYKNNDIVNIISTKKYLLSHLHLEHPISSLLSKIVFDEWFGKHL